jgi:hypothetical protein
MVAADGGTGVRASREPKQAKWAKFPREEEQGPSTRFLISRIETAECEDPLSPPPPPFDRDEMLVCMALAFCLAGASTSIVYRLLG